jgi:hypothetical protein
MPMKATPLALLVLVCSLATAAHAQTLDAPAAGDDPPAQSATKPAPEPDPRTQYPPFLANAFVGGHLSYVNYHFTDQQLEPGFRTGYVAVPHLGVRVDLFGYRVNRFMSVQAAYMRPAAWVTYHDINGDQQLHHVWMNFGAITVQGKAPITSRLSAYLEGGFGVASRRGFEDAHGDFVVRHAHYASPVLGAGLIVHATPSWDFTTGVTYIPHHAEDKQPASAFVSTGFRYNIGTGPAPRIEAAATGDTYIFPEHVVQVELTSGGGYGANKFFSSKVPIFWDGNVEIAHGLSVHYERNVFHTRKLFALDLGTSASFWTSRGNSDKFATLSVYPLLRFTLVRTRPADFFFMYSVAGPTYITKRFIDGLGTGGNFTFQDFMGAGAFIGEKRNVSLGVKITHYSNGNLFVDNAALKVPLTINLGYAF